eukprot:2663594-Rhodomonas_salina.1
MLADNIEADEEELPVVIPFSLSGIKLPEQGVRLEGHGINISTNAFEGPVRGQVMNTQAVGSLLGSTTVQYDPQKADNASTITFDFTPYMPLGINDVITIALPSFQRAAGSFDVESTPTGVILRAAWSSTRSELVFTVRAPTQERERVTIVVPQAAGLKLPIVGVREDQTTLTMRIAAASGVLPTTSIISSPPVGSFTDTTALQYEPLKVYEDIKLDIFFQTAMPLARGEQVRITLPGFSKRSGQSSIMQQPWIIEFTQQAGAQVLICTTNATIPAFGPLQHIEVSPSLMFQLPALGTRLNQQSLTISSNAVAGPVLSTSITSSPSVGSFSRTETLAFSSECRAGESSGCVLTIAFTPAMGFVSYDWVTVQLPLFQFASALDIVESTQGLTAAWSADTERMDL